MAVEMVREHIGEGKIDDAGLIAILGDLPGDANFSIDMTIEEYDGNNWYHFHISQFLFKRFV